MDNRKAAIREENVSQVISLLTAMRRVKLDELDYCSYPFYKHTKELPLGQFFKEALVELHHIKPINRINFSIEYVLIDEDQARNILIKMINIGKAYGRAARVKKALGKPEIGQPKEGKTPSMPLQGSDHDIDKRPTLRELPMGSPKNNDTGMQQPPLLEGVTKNAFDGMVLKVIEDKLDSIIDKVIAKVQKDNMQGLDTDTISVDNGRLTISGKQAGKEVILIFELVETVV